MLCGFKRSSGSVVRNVFFLIVVSGSCCLLIFERQQTLENQIERMISRVVKVREEQSKLAFIHEQFAGDLNKTMMNINAQGNQVEVLEQISKRYNLKILGVPEKSPDNPMEEVKKIINEKMGIKLVDDIDMAVRVDGGGQPRPILVKFSRWKDKTKVLYRKKSLTLPLKVEEDLTTEQRKNLKELEEYAKKAENAGRKVRWNGRQLFIDGELVKL